MKKILLSVVMAVMAIAANAQVSQKIYNGQTNDSRLRQSTKVQKPFQVMAPIQGLKTRGYVPLEKKLTLNPAKMKPVSRTQRRALNTKQAQGKAFRKGQVQNRSKLNLKPTMTVEGRATAQSSTPRKAPTFAETYVGMGANYKTKEVEQWTMTPTQASYVNQETGEESLVDVLVDIIPTPDYLADLYPNGIPVQYTVDENNIITIMPQAVANYVDEESGNTNYLTLFSANSNDEDGIINISVGENGKLTITNGNWICLGEFANVEFDEAMSDGDAYLGWDELYSQVAYYYHFGTTIDKEYKAHGVNYFANQPENWVMQRGTTAMDDDQYHFFVNMTPLLDTFAEIYPDGIDVEYEQEGSTITVKPQVIARISDEEEGDEYIMVSSGTSEDGCIVLTEGADGSLTTIKNESVIIGAWKTNEFDPTFNNYLGAYLYMDNVKYLLPDATPEAPEDVSCEPSELVLFAGLGISGYHFQNNLGIMGAYAPVSFRNNTFDIATNFEWSVVEEGDEEETTITGTDWDFEFSTKGGALYSDLTLTAYNETAKSEPYQWGVGHAFDPLESSANMYAGGGESGFEFSDGTYATMTRQNPDFDLKFYGNWGTPDITEKVGATVVEKIYSYQGKPSTPLFLTGVTLPLVSFEAKENFNLHISLYKCTRSNAGDLELGDLIAEGDANIDNVNSDYSESSGLTAINFDALYVVDDAGLSETVDYLFIDDEFVIVIDNWGNGSFSGVLGSQEYNFNEVTSTWYTTPGSERLHSYGGGWPVLFIGLNDATYGYLHTDDNTNLQFNTNGGEMSIHVDPMYYALDDETEQPSALLSIKSITIDGEEVEEVPEWLEIGMANEDYTTATGYDEEGNAYTYFVNGIDYDLVFHVAPMEETESERKVEIVFMQPGALLNVTVAQGGSQGISTMVTKTPLKSGRTYNLAGRSVKAVKGIIVKDGHKILMK